MNLQMMLNCEKWSLNISLSGSGNRLRVAGVAASPWAADTASPPSWTTTRPPSHRVQMQRSQTTKVILTSIFQRRLMSHVDLWSCNTLFPTQWYPLLRCRGTASCVPHLFSCESDARTKKRHQGTLLVFVMNIREVDTSEQSGST